ncbi:hypothetical protein HDU96_006574 [Phlyctochytrium bullatum]|nr:hypothetical protein HDU96_006574 [Phlyctochytrium bullatum]
MGARLILEAEKRLKDNAGKLPIQLSTALDVSQAFLPNMKPRTRNIFEAKKTALKEAIDSDASDDDASDGYVTDDEATETAVTGEAAKEKAAAKKAAIKKIQKRVKGLPIGGLFSTLVYNRLCQTDPHKVTGDLPGGWCVVVPCGKFKGGKLRFPETKLQFNVDSGHVMAFRSALLTHSNSQFHGFRSSLVFYTDKNLYDWLGKQLKKTNKSKDLKRFNELMVLQFNGMSKKKSTPKKVSMREPKKTSKQNNK